MKPEPADAPAGPSRHVHELRNLALAVRLAAEMLDQDDAAVSRIFSAADQLFELADRMEAGVGT